MKKKDVTNKPSKSKSIQATTKKSVHKAKPKPKEPKKEDPSFFVLLGDSFYVASSKTERKNYEQFEQKVKVSNSALKKSRSKPQNNFSETINLQEYVKTLSKQEKASLLRDLAKEVEPEKSVEVEIVVEQQDKMSRLTQKLESIKSELVARWDDQIGKINHCFENEQIGLQEKNEKISLIQKIKHNKIAMINYTKLLFEKILREEPDIELDKSERMENIINSLNSISSIDPRQALHQLQLDPYQFATSLDGPSLHQPIQPKQNHNRHAEHQEQHSQNEQVNFDAIKIEDSDKSESHIISRENLKLDIRLDEVEFGKDHYEEEIIFSKPSQMGSFKQPPAPLQPKTEILKLEFVGERREPTEIQPHPEKSIQDEFLCVGEQHQMQIPLLMTKDRLEQLEFQKSAKQIETLTICMKARQAFQVSELMSQTEHFTTLIDVNQFIVQFYQFAMRNNMREIIQNMNMPYGKSCIDKLFLLRQDGYVPDHDHSNVLNQEHLHRFHREYTLSIGILCEEQKAHNRALFQAFNCGLNVYRPYFELEGEVFPWNTSEKGLTFYEINEDNIEEVFEKSKMKVLEYCSSLCGLLPDCQITTPDAKRILTKRNEECYERVLKAEMMEHYGQWNIKKVNFEALSRVNLCEEIFQTQIERLCLEICHL